MKDAAKRSATAREPEALRDLGVDHAMILPRTCDECDEGKVREIGESKRLVRSLDLGS